MDLTQVDVEPSEASEVGMEPSEATSKESYFASQAKSAESKEWAKELVRDGDRKARALKRSATFKADQRFFHDKHGEGSVVSRSADGIVVMKFDNGEVHKYDLISQRKLRPIIEDAHTYTAETLFDIVDTDSSGVLEKAEFVRPLDPHLGHQPRQCAARPSRLRAPPPPCAQADAPRATPQSATLRRASTT